MKRVGLAELGEPGESGELPSEPGELPCRPYRYHWVGGDRHRCGTNLVGRLFHHPLKTAPFYIQNVFIRHVLTHAEYDKGDWKNDRWDN